MITLQRQFELLLQHVRNPSGRRFSVADIANATGLSEQTFLNLLHDRAHHPRLYTLQQLGKVFDISLDYFGLETEAQCLSYLAWQGKLGLAPETLRAIDAQALTLSSETTSNVLAILQWRRYGSTEDSKHRGSEHERKNHQDG